MEKLNNLPNDNSASFEYITAMEFMDALRIHRSKIDDLRHRNLIKMVEK